MWNTGQSLKWNILVEFCWEERKTKKIEPKVRFSVSKTNITIQTLTSFLGLETDDLNRNSEWSHGSALLAFVGFLDNILSLYVLSEYFHRSTIKGSWADCKFRRIEWQSLTTLHSSSGSLYTSLYLMHILITISRAFFKLIVSAWRMEDLRKFCIS